MFLARLAEIAGQGHDRQHAAVDHERLANDIAALVGRKKESEFADIVGRADHTGRDGGASRLLVEFAQDFEMIFDQNPAGRNGVDADAPWSQAPGRGRA